jgi:polyferredoxin
MRQIVVLIIILGFLLLAYFLNIYVQKLINPRQSFGRLMLYFLGTVVMIAVLTFLMVFIIGQLFPREIMK